MESIASRYKGSRTWIFLSIILLLVIALLVALIWGMDRENKRARRELQLNSLLTQSYYELVDHVDNLSNDLIKLMVSASPGANAQLLSRLSAQAQSAADNLAALPGGHSALEGTMGFLNQVGDMASALLRKTGGGLPLSSEDMRQLNSLNESCLKVMERLSQVDPMALAVSDDSDYYEGSAEGDVLSEALYGGETAIEYPSLIYDGPFSDSLKGLSAKGLETLTEVDETTALQAAARALWVEPDTLTFAGVETGQIEAYLFEGQTEETSFTAAITRRGGKLLWVLADRPMGEAAVDITEAERLAISAAERWGFGRLRVSWSQRADGMATISLIPTWGEASVYPDMVKIKVALDTGEILSMDASAYWMNHVRRSFVPVTVTRMEAANLVSPQLTVDTLQLAVIPTEGGGEKLCWEVDARFADARFFIYLDGQTGQELKIFRVVQTEEGIMTMEAE